DRRVKPLLIAALGRTISTAPLGRREDDVEVRRVPVLPTASSLDAARPTVIVLDHALLRSAGADRTGLEDLARIAAFVGLGNAEEHDPRPALPADLRTGYLAADAP